MKFWFASIAAMTMFLAADCIAESGGIAATPRYKIPEQSIYEAIAGALQQNQVEAFAFSLADLILPQGLTSREQYPSLEIVAIAQNAFAHQWQVSVRCRKRNSCGTFLVLVPEKQAGTANQYGTFRNFHFSHAAGPVTEKIAASPALVQAGKPATLVMENSDARITLPVVCLQRGTLNQMITTRDPETKKILRAKVIGPSKLQASF